MANAKPFYNILRLLHLFAFFLAQFEEALFTELMFLIKQQFILAVVYRKKHVKWYHLSEGDNCQLRRCEKQ